MPEDLVPVVIASGSPAFALGLASFLGDPPFDPTVVHTVGAALDAVRQVDAAMVLIDEWLADSPGTDLAFELRRSQPDVRTMFVVRVNDAETQMSALAMGAAGCIARTWDRASVAEAVADGLRGVSRFDLGVVHSLADMARRRPGPDTLLTDQERVVLRLMRQHLTYKEIAQQMGLSWHTVRTHAQSVLRKSGVHSRRDLTNVDGGLVRAGAL